MLFRSKSLFESVEAASELRREHVGACQGRRGEHPAKERASPAPWSSRTSLRSSAHFGPLVLSFAVYPYRVGRSMPKKMKIAAGIPMDPKTEAETKPVSSWEETCTLELMLPIVSISNPRRKPGYHT